jgi:hypothetical protein
MIWFAALAVLLGPACPFLLGQTGEDPTPPLRAAIEKGRSADSGKTRFTYEVLEHSQNFNQKGKIISDVTRRYEVIYIADLLYQHLLEVNGKPLAGQALADEQKRYDDAVRERTALDDAARAKLMHHKHKEVMVSFGQILTKYHNRVVEATQLNGRSCLLIDSTPLETVADAPKRHLRIWLDQEKSEFLRIDFDLLADEDDLLRGSSGSMSFTYIDGVLLDTVHHLDFTVPAKDKKKSAARVVSDQTFSNYRKFVSTTRILPDEEVRSPQ